MITTEVIKKNEINKLKRKGTKKMTKIMKKITSVFIAFVMIMAMGASAFAAGPYTITIKKKDTSDKSVHKYEVYQILKGESTDAGQLHSIDWGDHVDVSDESAVLAALSGATVLNTTCSNVEDVVEALKDLENNSAPLDNFASAISDFLKTTSLTATLAANASSTTVSVTEPGYYMVKDTITDNDNPSAVSKFMLKIVSNTNIDIDTKEEIPTLDKVIESATDSTSITTDGKKNTASVGDDINYKITTKVPDLIGKGYKDKYCFVVNDELSAGLTYKGTAAPTITIATSPVTTLVAGTDFTFDKDDSGSTTKLQIVFNPVKMLEKGTSAAFAGKEMTIKYTATLNEDAVMTDAGNPNTAELVYSNNPYQTYAGDVPSPSEPHGQTPESKTITYTTEVELDKVDANNTSKRLAGAEFQITGLSSNQVVTTAQRLERDDDAGTLYKLKDGSYTTEAPDGTNNGKYEDGKYKLVEKTEIEELEGSQTIVDFVVGDDGIINLSRLGAGTYTIKETKAPTGYVTSNTEHTLVIDCDLSGTAPVWTYTFDGDDITATPISIMIVDNMKVSDLPITGGIGTTIFYIAGSVLILAGVTLLIAKKRKINEA